ncbi:hypothetical protein HPB47_017677 [Ixodes persulcatus]|uniref:Uncharacterized protein n=1 Tax=Ixodes persulcatus TaxID=34615 RepID=A0AC60QMP9_IXOPE|nr:hypothetical protein HPB47_017677 [Ixodes persulcatus]
MHPRYRSKLGSVYLVVLAKFKDVVKHGLCAILKPVLYELEELGCQGLTVTVDGVPETMKVLVVAVCCDNLSQHKLGGFSASFSQGHVCRYCTATTANLHAVTNEEQCQIRTRADHSSHLAAAEANPQEGRKLHGVEENKHWGVLLQLHSIVTLVLSEKITEDWVAYLEVLVKDFVEAFTAMPPSWRFRNSGGGGWGSRLPQFSFTVHGNFSSQKFGFRDDSDTCDRSYF